MIHNRSTYYRRGCRCTLCQDDRRRKEKERRLMRRIRGEYICPHCGLDFCASGLSAHQPRCELNPNR